MTGNTYVPVPVAAAREVAERFGKAQVAIVSWDANHGLVHVTTFGATAADKVQAARLGEILHDAVNPSVPVEIRQRYEDLPEPMRAAVEVMGREIGDVP